MAQSAQWERVETAIRGEAPDRPPFGFWMHVPEIDRDPIKLARYTVDLTTRYKMDYVKVMFRSSWGLEDWGWQADRYHPTHGYWLPSKLPVQSPADWGKLAVLMPDQGALGEQLRLLRMVHEGLHDQGPVLATLFAPTMLAAQLTDEATFLRHLQEAPDAVHAGLKTITETMIEFARACLANGADGIFYAIKQASRDVMSEDAYKELGRAYDRPVLEAFHGDSRLTMLHLHGEALMFDELASYPAHVLNWYDRQGDPSLKAARARTKTALAGGIDHERTLLLGTPEEIAGQVADAVSQVDGRGLFLAPGCSVPIIAPDRHLRIARDAALGWT